MNRFNRGLVRICQVYARGNGIVLREKFLDGICQHPGVRPGLFIRTKEAT
jgi:hypothetical protein